LLGCGLLCNLCLLPSENVLGERVINHVPSPGPSKRRVSSWVQVAHAC
jgi:hypothetical protein